MLQKCAFEFGTFVHLWRKTLEKFKVNEIRCIAILLKFLFTWRLWLISDISTGRFMWRPARGNGNRLSFRE